VNFSSASSVRPVLQGAGVNPAAFPDELTRDGLVEEFFRACHGRREGLTAGQARGKSRGKRATAAVGFATVQSRQ
jgi:hypothetical protein